MSVEWAQQPARWTGGVLPANVQAGRDTVITGDKWTADQVFRKFRSKLEPGLLIGERCMLDGVLFNVGEGGRVVIGDDCRFEEVFLICEEQILIGDRVIIGWRATIVDSDFHPIPPRKRALDAVACSPLNGGLPRPHVPCRPVLIDDDVFIGPNASILKGVHIGPGAFVEPGTVVVRDVPARVRVAGNPCEIVGEV